MIFDKKYYEQQDYILNLLYLDEDKAKSPIAKCKISNDMATHTWTISEWYVNQNYQNQGLGNQILKSTLEALYAIHNRPDRIRYIWNGQNEYVHNWLQKKFSPLSECPIAVQKYSFEDDWSSHMYHLDVKAVLEYAEISELEEYNTNMNDSIER